MASHRDNFLVKFLPKRGAVLLVLATFLVNQSTDAFLPELTSAFKHSTPPRMSSWCIHNKRDAQQPQPFLHATRRRQRAASSSSSSSSSSSQRKRRKNRVPVPQFSDLAQFTSSSSIEEWLESLTPSSSRDEQLKQAFVEWSSRDQARFMAELGYHGESRAVVIFLHTYTTKNIIVLNAALSTLADLGCRQEMRDIWLEMQTEGIAPTSFTLATIFRSALGAEEILAWRGEFLKFDKLLTTDVFEAAIRACKGEPHTDKAWNTVVEIREWMKEANVEVTTSIYQAMFQVCADIDSTPKALIASLFDEVLQVAQDNPGALQFGDRFWGTILQAFAASKDDAESLKVLHLMNRLGFTPNARHCTTFIKTLSMAKKDVLAVEFLNKMSGLPCSAEEFGSLETEIPDQISVLAVLSALSNKDNYDGANEVLQNMKSGLYGEDAKPNEQAYNLVLSCCNSPARVKEIVREMRLTKRHRAGVIAPSLRTYSRAIAVCRREGDIETALHLFERVKDDGLQPDIYVYSAVIWTAAEVGDFLRAERMLQEMKSKGIAPNIVSYNGLLTAFASAGKLNSVLLVLEEIQSRLTARTTTFSILVRASKSILDDRERCSFLEEVYTRMAARDKHVSVGGQLIESLVFALGSQGRFEEAKNVFESLVGPSDAPNLRAMLFACSNADPPAWELALDYLHTSDILFRVALRRT